MFISTKNNNIKYNIDTELDEVKIDKVDDITIKENDHLDNFRGVLLSTKLDRLAEFEPSEESVFKSELSLGKACLERVMGPRIKSVEYTFKVTNGSQNNLSWRLEGHASDSPLPPSPPLGWMQPIAL